MQWNIALSRVSKESESEREEKLMQVSAVPVTKPEALMFELHEKDTQWIYCSVDQPCHLKDTHL